MILTGKKVLIMGIRNKWSIAWGAALAAKENGAEVIFTYNNPDNLGKIGDLIAEMPDAKLYQCDVSSDESIKSCFEKIKEEQGHIIAHANTSDMRNDFIKTSRDGFAHAADVSAYSLIAIANISKELDLLTPEASIVALSYYGAEKSVQGYNVMGVAKAALESSVRYLARDLGKTGIRVNAISAGPIKTLSAKGIRDFSTIMNVIEEKAPLHRNITAKEVGDVTAFLFSDMSRAITGEVIHVDNGFSTVGV